MKTRYDLVPFGAVGAIADVLAYGAEKYGAHNWTRGAAWSRYFAALCRHLFAWWRGELADPDTGHSHLAHAGCCLLFLLEYQLQGWGEDDRFRQPDSEPFHKDDGRGKLLMDLDWDQVGHIPAGTAPSPTRCCWVDPDGQARCQDLATAAAVAGSGDDDDGLD